MLQVKVKQLIEERNQYKQASENLEIILQKHGINTQSIQQIEKDLIVFTNTRNAALAQLEKKTVELDTERNNMKKILIQHKREIYDIKKEEQKEETRYYNVINSVNYNLYLQRISSELAVSRNKLFNKSLIKSSNTKTSKEKDLYSSNDMLLQKQLLYKMNHNNVPLNSSFYNTNGKNNSYNYPPIIRPYSTLSVTMQSNNDTQNKDFSKTDQEHSSEFFNNSMLAIDEYNEMRVQKMALDIALSQINDMDNEMMIMVKYNAKIKTKLLALEQNMSYSWREYA